MNYQEIKSESNFKKNLSNSFYEANQVGDLNGDESLMMHKNTHDFLIVSASKVSAKTFQGYLECVSNPTLFTLVAKAKEISEEQSKEMAEKVIAWMDAQK